MRSHEHQKSKNGRIIEKYVMTWKEMTVYLSWVRSGTLALFEKPVLPRVRLSFIRLISNFTWQNPTVFYVIFERKKNDPKNIRYIMYIAIFSFNVCSAWTKLNEQYVPLSTCVCLSVRIEGREQITSSYLKYAKFGRWASLKEPYRRHPRLILGQKKKKYGLEVGQNQAFRRVHHHRLN